MGTIAEHAEHRTGGKLRAKTKKQTPNQQFCKAGWLRG